MIDESRDAMYEALWHDLRRNRTDADLMDVDYNIREAEYVLKHLHDWVKPGREPTPLLMEPGHVRVRRDPFGVTLIIGAWYEPNPWGNLEQRAYILRVQGCLAQRAWTSLDC